MNESILTSIKKLLGIAEDYEHFDQDITTHINAALMVLTQLGVGPSEGFFITDKTTTWNDFIVGNNKPITIGFDGTPETGITSIGALKTYVYIKVKLVFDPPQNSFTIDSMNKQASEYEWRLNSAVDFK